MRGWPAALLLPLVLAACSLPGLGAGQTPTATATLVPPTIPPTLTPPATVTAVPTGPGPPTQPPPTMGPTVGLPPLAAGAEAVVLEIVMTDANRGWAIGGVAGDDLRLLRTTDGASSWRDVSPPIHQDWVDSGYRSVMAPLSSEEAWFLRYRPLQSPEPTGDVAAVWVTKDGGGSWQLGDPTAVLFLGTQGSPPYLVATESGQGWLLARAGGAGMHQYPVSLLRTTDGAQHWQVLSDPFDLAADGLMSCYKSGMSFASNGTGLLTIESCPVTGAEVRTTRDGGLTWDAQLLPEPADSPGIYDEGVCESHSPLVADEGQMTAGVTCRLFEPETTEAYIYRSGDGGASWQAEPYPGGDLHRIDLLTLWATTRQLWRSLDGGQTWEQRKEVFWDGQFSFVSADLGWAVAQEEDELALVRTDDGGETWAIVEPVIQAD